MTDMVTTNNDPDDSTSSCPNHKIEAQKECGIPIIVRWDPSPERKDEEGIALETLIPSSRQSVAGLTRYVVENVIFHLFLQRMIHSLKHKKKSSHDNITYHLHYGDGYTTHLKIKTTTNTTTTTNKSPVSLHDYHVDVCIRLYFPYTQHELHPMDTLHDLLALYPPSNNNKYEFSLITQWNAISTDISSLTTKKVLQQRSNNGNKEKKQRTLFVEMNLQKTSFQISLQQQQQQNHNEKGTKRKLQTQNDIPNDLEQPSQKRILNNNTTNEKKDNDAFMSSSSSSLVSYNSSLEGGNGNGNGNGNVDGDDEQEKEDEQFNSTNGDALTKNNDEAATTKLLTGASSKTIETDTKLDKSKNETDVDVSESTTAKINEKISPSKDDTMTKQNIDEGSNDVVNANDDEDSSSVSSDSSESSLEGNKDNQQSSTNISDEIDDTTTKPTNNDNPSKTVSITQLNDDKDELKNGDKDDDNASMSSSSSSSVSSDSSSEVSSSSSSSSDDDNDDDDGGGDEEDEEKHTNENNNDNLKVDPPNNTIPPGEVTPSEEHVEEEEDDDDEKKKNDKNMNDIDSSSKSSSSLPTSMSSVVSESSSPGKKDKDETKTNVPNEVAMDDHEDVSHMDTPIRELFKMDNTTAKTNNDTNKITTNNKNDEAENEKADKGQDDNGSSSSSSVSSSSLSSSSSDSESSIDEPEKSEELPVSQKHLRLSQSSQNSKKRRPQPLFDPKKIVIQAEKGGIRP